MEYKEVSDAFQAAHGFIDWLESKVNTGWVSRFYFMKVRVKWFMPPVLGGTVYETEPETHYSYGIAFHVLPRTALVVGIWKKRSLPEHEGLLRAVRAGRDTTKEDIEKFDDTITRERPAFDGVGSYEVSRLRDGATRDARAE